MLSRFFNTVNYFKYLFLFSLLSFFSYRATHALFSDTATSTNNTFTASETFSQPEVTESMTPTLTFTPTVTPTPTMTVLPTPTGSEGQVINPGDVVINEVSSAGDNPAEWVELYNRTSREINVSGWKILDNTDTDILPTVSPIPSNGYAVIITNNSTVTSIPSSAITIKLSGATIGGGLKNDGDKLELRLSTNLLIDAMSYGNNTSVFSTPPAAPGSDQSLARIPNGNDNDIAGDWQVDSSPTLGEFNSL